MTTPASSPVIFALVAILSFAFLVRLVSADTGSSGSFRVGQSVNDFGGGATSSSFQSISTGGQFVTGQSTSSNFQIDSGFEYFDTFTPRAQNWRWYDDETSETPVSALESENIAPIDIENDNPIKLRIAIAETAGYGMHNVKFKLQYSTVSDFSSDVHDLSEQNTCTFASTWCYADGVDTDGDIISTKLLSDTDACSGGAGIGCGTHNESGISSSTATHAASAVTEYEFTIKSSGTSPATTYFFRPYDLVSDMGVSTNTGESYPSLVSGGGTLSFNISGIEAASTTSGIITDIDTTPTQIDFGSLPEDTPIHAAQRLAVSTNANTGYEVFAYESQGFLGEQGAEIPAVDGTNAIPTTWTTGCTTGARGCFGYHTSESVLGIGNVVRFAANDTYAGFSQSLSEVAYSASAVDYKTTDIVYKVETHQLQDSDTYSTNLTYIVVPVF